MPTYEYDCPQCGPFAAVRRMAERDAAAACPVCATASPRGLFTAPAFGALPAAVRQAHATNERARHEPKLSSAHGAGCGCCAGGSRAAKNSFTSLLKDGSTVKGQIGRRPWMVSH